MYCHVIMSIQKQTIYVHHYTGMSKGSKVQPKREPVMWTFKHGTQKKMHQWEHFKPILDPHSAQRTD
jgi:hypothetical protein